MKDYLSDSENESSRQNKEGQGPPSVPQTNVEEEKENDASQKSSTPEDPNLTVELQIRNLIQLLSNCIGEICGSQKVTSTRMEEYRENLRNCLASIDAGLSEQMNAMEESLMSTDINCCRALYDEQIEEMDGMFEELIGILDEKVLSPVSAKRNASA